MVKEWKLTLYYVKILHVFDCYSKLNLLLGQDGSLDTQHDGVVKKFSRWFLYDRCKIADTGAL